MHTSPPGGHTSLTAGWQAVRHPPSVKPPIPSLLTSARAALTWANRNGSRAPMHGHSDGTQRSLHVNRQRLHPQAFDYTLSCANTHVFFPNTHLCTQWPVHRTAPVTAGASVAPAAIHRLASANARPKHMCAEHGNMTALQFFLYFCPLEVLQSKSQCCPKSHFPPWTAR